MSDVNFSEQLTEAPIPSLVTGLLISLLSLHVKLPYYQLALPSQYEIVTLNICKIFKLRISFWILQWFHAHLLCNFHAPINNRKLFWKRNPSLTKNLHHSLQVNVTPLLYENLAESSLKNALSHNLQEKLDAHNTLHPSSICLESTLDLVILCHQAALKS